MSRLPALVLVLAALPWPLEMALPDWVDRYRFNPRERSEAAVEAYGEEDYEAAVEAAETALRVAPQRTDEDGRVLVDPRLAYNAGTARLAAGDEGKAVDLLEQAAQEAPPELAPGAHYNLGNARLADGDAAGAVEAFKSTLRLRPDDAAAKHNLEVALRRLEEQRRMQMGSSRETPGGDRQGEREEGDRGGPDDPADQEQQEGPEQRDEQGRGRPQPQPPEQEQGGDSAEPRPLPRFEDQPDMTAEQAAAVLEAVENLERRQRQEEAAERARRSGRGEKDW